MTEPESVTTMTEGLKTPLTELLDITAPVVQAPISDLVRPPLVAAVSNAGGLGMHPLSWTEPEALEGIIAETRELTAKPFGVNLVLDFEQDERLGICLDAGVELISFFWGDPDPFVGRVHAAGAKAMHTVASADEAKRAVDAGIDIIVAQGWEAGGRVWGEVGGMALIPRARASGRGCASARRRCRSSSPSPRQPSPSSSQRPLWPAPRLRWRWNGHSRPGPPAVPCHDACLVAPAAD